jgi:outer membrane protein assembly factor BamB
MRTCHQLLFAAFASAVVTARAADWPQWRGPDRDDVSKETGLLQTWPDGGPKLLWTYREAGAGYSGPAVVGSTLYAMGAEGGKEYLYALDLETRNKAWSAEVGPVFCDGHGDGPRGTPTVDGDHVYGLGAQGDLVCVERDGGGLVWRKNLESDLGGEMWSEWGYSESPMVDGGQVVCTPGGKNGTLAALDKKTGRVVWRSKEWPDKAAYSSVMPTEVGGVRQYVQMTGESVAGVAADDGRLLWRCRRSGPTAPVPTPIVDGDYVYVTSGYNAGCLLLRLTAQGRGTTCAEVHKNKHMVNHHGGVLLTGGCVYGYDDNKGLVCQDFKTTDILWAQRDCDALWDKEHNRGVYGKMSLTCADGHLYCYGEDAGAVLLVEATPKGLNVDGRFTIPDHTKLKRKSGKVWTHPVVADGRLYLRDQDLIFCYDVKDAER